MTPRTLYYQLCSAVPRYRQWAAESPNPARHLSPDKFATSILELMPEKNKVRLSLEREMKNMRAGTHIGTDFVRRVVHDVGNDLQNSDQHPEAAREAICQTAARTTTGAGTHRERVNER